MDINEDAPVITQDPDQRRRLAFVAAGRCIAYSRTPAASRAAA